MSKHEHATLARVYGLVFLLMSAHLFFIVTIEGLMLWRTKIGDFNVKPVRISGFSILAHACSCVLTAHSLFFVTNEGLMMFNKQA